VKLDVITLFPEMVEQIVAWGVVGRAANRGLLELSTRNPRDQATDVHRTVDDRPYGGGPGMLMRPEPLAASIREARRALPQAKVLYLSPQGRVFDQAYAAELAEQPELILLCGRYEGIDERLLASEVDAEVSIGDYVLSGGEPAAMVMVDAIARLLDGALGHSESAAQDSFSDGLLDCPHFTRPEVWEGQAIPAVLKSGDHKAIAKWRRQQALGRTALRRPELLEQLELNKEDQRLLADFSGQPLVGQNNK
jgi:tRNA (guanine37-N1)-methyltransferase